MQRWEYHQEWHEFSSPRDNDAVLPDMKALGAEGWELVTVMPVQLNAQEGGYSTFANVLYFKRPVE